MVALYEPGAVLDYGGDELAVGVGAIRRVFEQLMEEGRKFDHGQVRSPVVSDDLALTSTVLPDGDITAEVAWRQDDGSWRWAIDRFSIL